MKNPVLVCAETEKRIADVRALFEEYRKSLDIDLCFQQYKAELASLPGKYAPPSGRLYVLYNGEPDNSREAAGCIALRPLETQSAKTRLTVENGQLEEKLCEMKRLYVRPSFRGRGFARILAGRILDDARKIGYSAMYLDTLDTMTEAVSLYESIGFERTQAYYENPDPRAVYMKKVL